MKDARHFARGMALVPLLAMLWGHHRYGAKTGAAHALAGLAGVIAGLLLVVWEQLRAAP